jgi:tetratricopeptide (TPR) repeat protein
VKHAKGFGKSSQSADVLRLFRRAEAHQSAGRFDDAEVVYRQLLIQQPENCQVLQAIGRLRLKYNDPYSAKTFLHQAIVLEPQNALLHHDLGLVLESQGRFSEAEVSCLQSIRLAPQMPEAYSALGNVQLSQGKLFEAEESYRQAITLRPNSAEFYCNLGNVLQETGKYQEALAAYQYASSLMPDLIEAQANQAAIHLISGEFEIGWEKYALRWDTECNFRTFDKPIWQGEDLRGKRIFIYAEKGFGDTFQSIRYAELLFDRGAIVLVECRITERRLLRSCSYIHQLLTQGESLPEFDFYAPLFSLPRLMGTTLETIPTKIPYLYTSDATNLSEEMQKQVKEAPGCKIGLVWSASRLRFIDRKRSFPLALLEKLLNCSDISWFSLYKGDRAAELEPLGQMTDLGSKFHDFADTAWAISQMDLVISVDTSVVHLAGAMGKPTWVLLPYTPDWRWLLERDDSPWYPSVRLFRQPNLGNWNAVIESVGNALVQQFGLPQINPMLPTSLPAPQETGTTQEVLRACQLAFQNQEAGRLNEAKIAFQHVLKMKPDHSGALNSLGMVYQELGDLNAAESLLRQAILLEPTDPYYHFNLSLVLASQRKIPEAEVTCKQAVSLDPEFAEALNTLGNLCAAQGKFEDAERSYRQALAIRSDFAGTLNNLGNVLATKGDLEEAAACYEKALQIKPDLVDAANNRIHVLARIQVET